MDTLITLYKLAKGIVVAFMALGLIAIPHDVIENIYLGNYANAAVATVVWIMIVYIVWTYKDDQ